MEFPLGYRPYHLSYMLMSKGWHRPWPRRTDLDLLFLLDKLSLSNLSME
jgi:hypothetical protein